MITIGAAARQTGISAATLRKWESRYGFPVPVRTEGDQRAFHTADLDALNEISRRMANGQRAGVAIQAVKLGKRQALTDCTEPEASLAPEVSQAIDRLLQNDLQSFESCLARHFTQMGAAVFALQFAIPMIEVVGSLWRQDRLPVYAEHLFSSILQKVLQLPAAAPEQSKMSEPRVLLSSPAGESHTLALSLLNAMLHEVNIPTVFLQGGLPAAEIAAAAKAFKVTVVALSASVACPPKLLTAELRSLRLLLDESVELWIGGAGTHRISTRMAGVQLMTSLNLAVQTLQKKFRQAPNLLDQKSS